MSVSIFMIAISIVGMAAAKKAVRKDTAKKGTTKSPVVGMANPASTYCTSGLPGRAAPAAHQLDG